MFNRYVIQLIVFKFLTSECQTQMHVVTSHAFYRFNQKRITVRLMDHARDTSSEAMTIDRKVENIVIHRKYDDTTFNNDIALIRLDEEVKIEGRLRPVCLPTLGMYL